MASPIWYDQLGYTNKARPNDMVLHDYE